MEILYKNPKYYEMAFSFRDISKEVDLFEEAIERYALIPVKRFLEVGSGTSPHLEELVKRGYEYVGIDKCKEMLDYARSKAKKLNVPVELVCADMIDFRLEKPADFGYVLLGSLYIKDTNEMISHFNAMGKTIEKGGLYLLDWCVQFAPFRDNSESWEIEKNEIQIKVTTCSIVLNRIDQTYEETITVQVNDDGHHKELEEKCIKRAIYPQEFLMFISNRGDFEFVGWWNNWDLSKPLDGTEQINRPIIILRKK